MNNMLIYYLVGQNTALWSTLFVCGLEVHTGMYVTYIFKAIVAVGESGNLLSFLFKQIAWPLNLLNQIGVLKGTLVSSQLTPHLDGSMMCSA